MSAQWYDPDPADSWDLSTSRGCAEWLVLLVVAAVILLALRFTGVGE